MTLFEEFNELDHVVSVGRHGRRVDAVVAEHRLDLLAAAAPRLGVVVAHGARRGVGPHLAAALGVAQLDDAHVGELRLAGVVDADAHQVMLSAGNLEGVFERLAVGRGVEEVREDEGRAVLLVDVGQEAQRFGELRARALGAEADQFADNHEDVAAPLLRGDELLDAVREEDAAHLVVVLGGREGQHGGNLRDDVLLEPVGRAEHPRGRDVDDEHHRQLALLLVDLDVGLRRACRDVPVDVAHVVAGAVLPHLGKRHAASPEGRVVLSGENLVRKTAGLDFDFADASENIVLALFHARRRVKVR